MSHFTVLVIGENPEAQLQPFHEFECTGENDQYVQDISILDEKREEYENGTRKMARYTGDDSEALVAEDSKTLRSAFDDLFYRKPTKEEDDKIGRGGGTGWGGGLHWASREWSDGSGYSTKVHDTNVPGWEEVEMAVKDLMTFTEFCLEDNEEHAVPHNQEPNLASTHKFGYVKLNANGEVQDVINRTNPNKKWDWYTLGGRWSGFFSLKNDNVLSSGTNKVIGDKGDRSRIGDINFKGMREEARKEAEREFDKYWDIVKDFPDAESWSEVRDRFENNKNSLVLYGEHPVEAARNAYRNQPVIQAFYEKKMGAWGCPIDIFGRDREAYVQRCENSAAVPFAVLKDGKWHERGSMGWWGCVSGEMNKDEWAKQMSKLYDELHPDTLVSLFDCHI